MSKTIESATASVLKDLRDMYSKEDLSIGGMIQVVTQAMLLVEKIGGLTGPEKRKLVLSCVETLVREKMQDGPARVAILAFLKEVAPNLIDSMVWNGKNGITFNAKRCFGFCC